jgi:hypothetical protein
MRQSAQTVVTTTTEIEPKVAARISAVLSVYSELKLQADLLYEGMEEEKAKIFEIMKDAGYEKMEIDGVGCTIVRGTSSKLDKMKFVELGGSLEQLANATVTKPKKAYLRIGAAKEEDAS